MSLKPYPAHGAPLMELEPTKLSGPRSMLVRPADAYETIDTGSELTMPREVTDEWPTLDLRKYEIVIKLSLADLGPNTAFVESTYACMMITTSGEPAMTPKPMGESHAAEPIPSLETMEAQVVALTRRVDQLQSYFDHGACPGSIPEHFVLGPSTPPMPLFDLARPRHAQRRRPRGRKALLLMAAVVALIATGVLASPHGMSTLRTRLLGPAHAGVILYTVTPSKLSVRALERGTLESSQSIEVLCEVEGKTTILSLLPEGTYVTKGQLVCELDSSALDDVLINQIIGTKQAEASYQNANLTRQVAEIAVKEYENGLFVQDYKTVLGEITLKESELQRAENREAWSRKMVSKGYLSSWQHRADQLVLQKSQIELNRLRGDLNVLLEYTRDRMIKELKSAVEKARADELARQSVWEYERAKEAKLRRQIEKCKLYAPGDGMVVYFNDQGGWSTSGYKWIEEGGTVRERQKIFTLPNVERMRVNAKIHEMAISRVKPGLRARIWVEALPEQVLTGTVEGIAAITDPTNLFTSSDAKVYTTLIKIDKGIPGLRPGMTAQVEIQVAEVDHVLSVPVQAVLQFQGKDYVYVMTPDGPKRRAVTLGISNDKYIEVKDGIKAGDRIALNSSSLMTEEERLRTFLYPYYSNLGK